MKVAIDRNSINFIEDVKEFEFIYVFENETIEELKKTGVRCVRYGYIDEVDINLTDYKINCLKKAKVTDKDWKVMPEYIENKFAIIIPNYNYEEWIDKCLGSVETQTYKNYEVIFVDDMSTDKSVDKVEKYVDKLPCLKIIKLKQKRLNGGARNEAYLHISDDVDYVMYLDSDDWYVDDKVLERINRKLQRRPDVLFIGLARYSNYKLMDCYKPNYADRYEAIKSWSGSCGKVIKKELATRQECLYNEGTLKEDRNQHCRICIYMKDFECLEDCVYVWNQCNRKSITTVRDKEIWGTSTIRHYADTLQLQLQEQGKDERIDAYLKERVNKCKREMEVGGDAQW